MSLPLKVISGGQTGADQGALFAAREAGIATGGWAPKGWKTEDGPAPWLAGYGLEQHESSDYSVRTRANVADSDGTLWFGQANTKGYWATLKACKGFEKPFRVVRQGEVPITIADWARGRWIETLNVAGNRESVNPGIGRRTEAFLAAVFRELSGDSG